MSERPGSPPATPPTGTPGTGLLHDFFTRAAERWPGLPAVDVPPGPGRPERRVVSFETLRRQAMGVATALRGDDAPDSVVAVLLPRTSEQVYAAQLGVLLAGTAHACIDPAFPDEQVRAILADAEAIAVLTDADGVARMDRIGFRGRIHDVAHLLEAPPSGEVPAPPPPPGLSARSLAYVIYTSGTTGRPKGVMIEHAGISSLIASDLAEFGLGPGDRVAQGSSAAYDSSVEEVWLALAAGATVVVMDDAAARLGPDLVDWLARERITVLCPPPTLLRSTGCADPAAALPGLRLLYVGGEALTRDVADAWAVGRRLENGYGPTECTVTALRTRIEPGADISIGRPVPGLQAWVLNDALEEVPTGQAGELCLGGVGLARGYRNRPDLTREKFPDHPRLGRIYRTGDLVVRRPDGAFDYQGRIDAQVKLRGYRVELEAIETRLVECDGVREAACRVQGEGAQQCLVAWIVPASPAAPPDAEHLKATLRRVLPAYMVPARIGFRDSLPKSVSGKLNRRDLPDLSAAELPDRAGTRTSGVPTRPSSPAEARVLRALESVFPRLAPIDPCADFFDDLGGDSLTAAMVVSRLREDPATAAITVRDLYEARSTAGLASRVLEGSSGPNPDAEAPLEPVGHPRLATLVQSGWMLLSLAGTAGIASYTTFHAVPWLTEHLGLAGLALLGPALGLLAITAITPFLAGLAVLMKWMLVGRYRATRVPVWGGFYLRHWLVQQALRLVPWWVVEGTEFQNAILRALGARIGRRVHLHRGVDLLDGGWDLLTIGDDVTLSQDACLQLSELEDRHLVFAPVTVGDRTTLDIHAGVGGNTRVGSDCFLCARAALPRGGTIPAGECWDGIPARPVGPTPPAPPTSHPTTRRSPWTAGCLQVGARLGLLVVLALPTELLALLLSWHLHLGVDDVLLWLQQPSASPAVLLGAALLAASSVPLALLMEACVCRALGRVPEGVSSRWEAGYVRIWLKTGLVDSAGRWLYGTLFWPPWLRLAGMKVGPGCEISGLIDTLPETVAIGARTFCADGIYLGGPRLHRGTVTVAPVQLGTDTFLGNGVVVLAGQRVPDDLLLGVGTVADPSQLRPGSAWFGHPPFELPRREVLEQDRRLTHEPSGLRYANRVFWELLRFALPVAPAILWTLWLQLVGRAQQGSPGGLPGWLAISLVHLGMITGSAALVIALKWALLGRVRPGVHALWSCWASRWDFVCLAWSLHAIDLVLLLEGSLLLNALLRVTGVRVGRRVVLGGGFAHDLPDPDMLTIEDDATVDCLFQAHTFEDRVLKLDHVRIRRGATVGHNVILLYGAEVGARTRVVPHSVVMKHERLLANRTYAGFPTRPTSA